MFVSMFCNLVVHIYFGRKFVIASTWSSWRIFELFGKSIIIRFFTTIKYLGSIYLTASYFFLLWWVKAQKPNFFLILIFGGLARPFVLIFPLFNVTISIYVLYSSLCIFGPLLSLFTHWVWFDLIFNIIIAFGRKSVNCFWKKKCQCHMGLDYHSHPIIKIPWCMFSRPLCYPKCLMRTHALLIDKIYNTRKILF